VTGGVPWYAEGTLIRGYQVGGKTGTAQIWDSEHGKYKRRVFNFSFVGFIGSDDPELIVAVRLADTRPRIRDQGVLELDVTSYQLFRRIAKMAVRELGIPRSKDPDAGYPIPLSAADRVLTPRRFEDHQRDRATGRGATGRDRDGGAPARRDDGEQGSRRDDQAGRTRSSRSTAADAAR
jgi:hypothetical protein